MAKDRIIRILGVPFNGDGTTPAEENPADALRLAGITDFRSSPNLKVDDLGDIEIPTFSGVRDPDTFVLDFNAWKEISHRTAERLKIMLDDGVFLIVLGGDCSILLGVFGAYALADKSVGLMMLDGHTDYREPTSSPSGEPADLETAVLTGIGPKQLINIFGKAPLINPHDIVVCGYREPDMIKDSKIRHFSAEELKQKRDFPVDDDIDKKLWVKETKRKKAEQKATGKMKAEQFGITSPESVFTRLAEIFDCAAWEIRNVKNEFVAETKACKLCAIAKKIDSASPCYLYCLDLRRPKMDFLDQFFCPRCKPVFKPDLS